MLSTIAITVIFLVSAISAAVTPTRSPFVGTITAPNSGSTMVSGDTFTFNYQARNWCQQDYTQFKVSLVSYQPTFDNVTDPDGTLQSVMHEFGTFTIANFPCE